MDSLARPSHFRSSSRPAPPRRRGRSYLPALVLLAGVCVVAANLTGKAKPPEAARPMTGEVRVVDGDTLRAGDRAIRIVGIDAPERNQTCRDSQNREWACGAAAAARLAALVAQGQVTCAPQGQDRYHRTLAVCASGEVADLGRQLVREGLALNYSFDAPAYAGEEQEARAAGRGLWQGAFERPQDWRRRHAQAGTPTAQ